MDRSKLKKVCLFLCVLFLMTAASALASTVYVINDTTAYTTPDTGSEQYGTLEAGTRVTLSAYNSTWAKIVSGKKSAYVKTEDLAAVKDCGGITVYAAKDTEVLKTFRASSAFATLSKGDAVSLYATVGDWAYVKRGGNGGFVKKSALSKKRPADSGEPEREEDEKGITAYVKEDGVKAYRSASASSKILCTLSCNDKVLVTKVGGSWCRCVKDGAVGYIRKGDLSTSKVDETIYDTFTAYAKEDGTRIYDASSSVIAAVKQNTALTVTAYNSSWARVKYDGGTAFVKTGDISTSKIPEKKEDDGSGYSNGSSTKPATGTAVEIDWWTGGISSILSVGKTFTITDVSTGIAWREKRVGGTNHCDSTPVSAEDTAAMKKACKSWSWDRRAVFVTVDGTNYAASINCMPHGSVTNTANGFGGHHCVHFTNSRTHESDKVCPLHQAAIKKAAKATLK